MTNSTITLEGTQEQVLELLRAVEAHRIGLLGFGGESKQLDAALEKRIQIMSYWEGHIEVQIRLAERAAANAVSLSKTI